MASASLPPRTLPLSEDFQCAICLEVFTDPVTISCGHNFCKDCIDKCWKDCKVCKCPVCMKAFVLRPELCVNTAFRDIASVFKSGSSPDLSTPAEVPSDDRSEPKCKSSLDCGASRCEDDLGRHSPPGELKLVDPGKTPQDKMCRTSEVQEEADFSSMDLPIGFNSSDQTSDSVQCKDIDQSEGHTAPVDSERTEKKVQKQEEEGEDVTSSTEANTSSIEANTSSTEANTSSIEANTSSIEANTSSIEANTSSIEANTSSIEASNAQRNVESQQEEAEVVASSTETSKVQQSQQEKDARVTSSTEASDEQINTQHSLYEVQQIMQSQKEKAEVATSSAEASNLPLTATGCQSAIVQSQLPQDIQSQQEEAEVVTPAPAEPLNRSQSLPQMTLLVSVLVVFIGWLVYTTYTPLITQRETTARTGSEEPCQSLRQPKPKQCNLTRVDMQQLIQDCMLKLQKDTFSTDLNEIPVIKQEAMQSECELQLMQKCKVSVTLDPDTAYPFLVLSEDGKQARHANTRQNVPDNPKRFQYAVGVLGKEGFSSGKLYYEVQVKDKTKWDLGVAAQSIDRRGKGRVIACPENGRWTLSMKRENEYVANTNPQVPISLSHKPQKVGVFVDYEEGQVSFYDVDNKSHIYSFTGQMFTEELYPFFNPGIDWDGMNPSPLVITPVNQKK